MKENRCFLFLFLFVSFFFVVAQNLFAMQDEVGHLTQEQLALQYEQYVLGCMYTTLNPEVAGMVKFSFGLKDQASQLQNLFSGGIHGLFTSSDLLRDLADESLPDDVKDTIGIKEKSSGKKNLKVSYKQQMRERFGIKIREMNASFLRNAEGIILIDEGAKLAQFDALFVNAVDHTKEMPAQEICAIFDDLNHQMINLMDKVQALKKDAKKKYTSSLLVLFHYKLYSSEKMKPFIEFNKKWQKIMGVSSDPGLGEVRTIDGILEELGELFSQENYEQLKKDQSLMNEEIARIKAEFNRLTKSSIKTKEDLLEAYKKVYKTAALSTQALKVINSIIVALEVDMLPSSSDNPKKPLSQEALAELQWYLDEIPKFKQWRDPWYASGPIVVPLGFFTVFFASVAYLKYRSHQDAYLQQLKDKIAFLAISRKEREQLYARIENDFMVKYIPLKVLTLIDSMASFFEIEQKESFGKFDKKVNKLYEASLDKKEAQLFIQQ